MIAPLPPPLLSDELQFARLVDPSKPQRGLTLEGSWQPRTDKCVPWYYDNLLVGRPGDRSEGDGIVAGLGIIASAFFWGAASLAGQPVIAFWAAVLLGTSIGLYFWNGVLSKFFLGDSGAQTIGFLLASLGILYNPLNRSPESSWIVPIMLLSVPIVPAAVTPDAAAARIPCRLASMAEAGMLAPGVNPSASGSAFPTTWGVDTSTPFVATA